MNADPIINSGNPLKPVPPALPGVKPATPAAQPVATPPTTQTTSTPATNSGSTTQQVQDSNFDIPEGVKEKYPDLVELILGTKSMNDKEKQYWFHILPVMKDPQVEKLRKILINEKQKLAEIDKKYSQKLQGAQEQKVSDWKGEDFKEKLVTIKQAELSAEEQEKAHEEELLNQLNNL